MENIRRTRDIYGEYQEDKGHIWRISGGQGTNMENIRRTRDESCVPLIINVWVQGMYSWKLFNTLTRLLWRSMYIKLEHFFRRKWIYAKSLLINYIIHVLLISCSFIWPFQKPFIWIHYFILIYILCVK